MVQNVRVSFPVLLGLFITSAISWHIVFINCQRFWRMLLEYSTSWYASSVIDHVQWPREADYRIETDFVNR